ncbi:hypothetical protein HK096_009803, partial [Nowakowskiella sp. JEL0078]
KVIWELVVTFSSSSHVPLFTITIIVLTNNLEEKRFVGLVVIPGKHLVKMEAADFPGNYKSSPEDHHADAAEYT